MLKDIPDIEDVLLLEPWGRVDPSGDIADDVAARGRPRRYDYVAESQRVQLGSRGSPIKPKIDAELVNLSLQVGDHPAEFLAAVD